MSDASKDYPRRVLRKLTEGMALTEAQFERALAELMRTGKPEDAMKLVNEAIRGEG